MVSGLLNQLQIFCQMYPIEPIALDISKTFVGLPHKPKPYGILGRVFSHISHFLVNRGSIFGPTIFLLYINDLDGAICDIAIYANVTSLYSECESAIRYQIYANNKRWLLVLKLNCETLKTEAGRGLLISILKILSIVHLTSLITLLQLIWKWIFLLKETHF